jgi:hypothetical protein
MHNLRKLTHPRDDNWVTIAAPIPFVPPVTSAFLESRRQKLAGGGGGTDKSLELDAWATEKTIASPWRRKKNGETMEAGCFAIALCDHCECYKHNNHLTVSF